MGYVLRTFLFSKTTHPRHFALTIIQGVRWPLATILALWLKKLISRKQSDFFPQGHAVKKWPVLGIKLHASESYRLFTTGRKEV